ncbi:tryptophan--tRNA ligase [Mycoplasmopsis cricetuli]|uniref:tryptophan--tRNA ligase n=1 Tax=Mycoplasmopsis cricetuli TaxID=171283 RepID=UPI00046FF43E|nr:tryptophan--tRNA ligase [Mycoplasmopsis cricetuli]
MKRLVSGIKPTGQLTLGNYIGAIQNFIKLQDSYQSYFFVADLHALTTGSVIPSQLKNERESTVAIYLACGLDPNKANIFYQSSILEHSQLMWICNSETTIGELERMTQYKDKAKTLVQGNKTIKIPSNLLMYPVLMAADILLYNANFVPVGEDQIQHIELTRNIAERLNRKYNINLTIPKAIIPQFGAKIKSLTNPEIKMSKSNKDDKGVIYLLEDPNLAYKKILKALTDSEEKIYISENKPGVVNLLTIYASLKEISIKQAEDYFKDYNYKNFKEEVAQVVKDLLIKIQANYKQALTQVDKVVFKGKKNAATIAKETIYRIQSKIGLYEEKNESK